MSMSPTVRKWLLVGAAVVLLVIVIYFVVDFVSWRIFEAGMIRQGGTRIP